jgi:TetR/AcrR family transcriptional regulator
MRAKSKTRKTAEDRRKDIIEAAGDLFSRKGFNGTTTRDLASGAGVHEAVLFRHFKNKEEIYSAALENRLSRNRQSTLQLMEKCADVRDDYGFFAALARGLLTRFEDDVSIPRLILFSALEGHEPANVVTERQLRVERPTLEYISLRIREGAFRRINPNHAAFAFGAMLWGYVVRQHVVGMAQHKVYKRDKIVQSFVTIFLDGIKAAKRSQSRERSRRMKSSSSVTTSPIFRRSIPRRGKFRSAARARTARLRSVSTT